MDNPKVPTSAGASKKIVREGDAKINVIISLGELKHLSSCMSKSTFHLNEYVDDNLESSPHKTVILKQIRLLIRSLDVLSNKVTYITAQQGVTKLSNRTQDRIRAAENRQTKIYQKMNVKQSNPYISPLDNVLASIVHASPSKKGGFISTFPLLDHQLVDKRVVLFGSMTIYFAHLYLLILLPYSIYYSTTPVLV